MSTAGVSSARDAVPAEVRGWNWGAFFLTFIWGIPNRAYLSLLVLVPCLGTFSMPFVLGWKGNEWAWRNGQWQSVEHFKRVQRKWARAGVLVFVATGALSVAFVFGINYTLKNSDALRLAKAKLDSDPRVEQLLGRPIDMGFVGGSISAHGGGAGNAELSVPVEGPRAKGRLYVIATQQLGQWAMDRLELELESGERIDLRAPPAPARAPAPVHPAAPPPPVVTTPWPITAHGIGELRLGDTLKREPKLLAASYAASYYADAQPLEGFQLSEPPVLAAVSGGPFEKWGEGHPGDPAPPRIRSKAVSLARAGKLRIGMLVITDPRPKTTAGIGVGDSGAAFARAYPQAPVPEQLSALWEEPTCTVQMGTLWFFFDRCQADAQAKVIRIVVREPD